MNAEGMAAMIPSWLPAPMFWNFLIGLALVAASVSIVWNKKAKLACLLLTVLLFSYVLFLWIPQLGGADEQQSMMAMSMLLKDFGLMGGALIFAGIAKD